MHVFICVTIVLARLRIMIFAYPDSWLTPPTGRDRGSECQLFLLFSGRSFASSIVYHKAIETHGGYIDCFND